MGAGRELLGLPSPGSGRASSIVLLRPEIMRSSTSVSQVEGPPKRAGAPSGINNVSILPEYFGDIPGYRSPALVRFTTYCSLRTRELQPLIAASSTRRYMSPDLLLTRMGEHQNKKTPMLRALRSL